MASINPAKISPWLAMFVIAAIGVSYFTFLYATWRQFQAEQALKAEKIDEILDRLPKAAKTDDN